MKVALAFVIGCLVVLAVSAAPEYTSKFDNIDVDQILTSDRLLMNYFNCLMERGTCTAEGKELREKLPDAIGNECNSCSEKQKEGARKVIRFLAKNKPDLWSELTKKYDPEGKHLDKLADIVKDDAK